MTGLPNQRSRSFAQAVFSYDGTQDYEQVEIFLNSARKYKSMKNLLDIDALRSLPLILKGNAATWWNGVKHNISTWNDFEAQLRKTFAPNKPAYVVFQEISELRQKPDELTERFVTKQKALFNQLNPPLAEGVQLDMMYGFLHPKVQEQIPRECIQSIDGLLEAARALEQEKVKDKSQNNKSPEKTGRKRVRCNFCRNFGHVADVCRKKQKVEAQTAAMEAEAVVAGTSTQRSDTPASPEPTLSSTTPASPVKETMNDIDLFGRSLLMMEISVGTATEMAFVDTGADVSVASYKLYSYLKNIGFHFQEEHTTITMADGIRRPQNILTGRIPVKLKDRCILTKFVVMPEARKCKTLLGCEFFVDANIELNLPQLAWSFNDEPGVYYDLIEED
ncbi:hypothetical protein PYW07_002055 [Mythimna separata]|uniref:Retrotransposon gag domain-containing protein n=1 Tax=Mythimna separata TaxID=271217 RepID=A0AAD7YNT6_MYTSE|nr:hypothetical protein PYW07_002055 [Mythimna separata]